MTATFLRLFCACSAILLIGGCMTSANYHNSSVVDFLYPNQQEPLETQRIPLLTLPLRVGVAFTPTSGYRQTDQTLTEKNKADLMREVSERFKEYDFVKRIEIIPSTYLRPGGGFQNLDSIRRMLGIDVIALLSYDQTRFTDEGWASIAYWTLVGAYMVRGEKNDTHTMLDAAVYDIASRNLLFRAPGVSMVKSKATPIGLSQQQREDSAKGFTDASVDLAVNLEERLALFREQIKESPEEIQIARRKGYTGGGSADLRFLVLGLLLVATIFYRSSRES